ncbi:hypothetical protein MKW98_008526 [Papaver atlanticum]|uniref:Uncharacterized protein n=1 Tax=Papaver atlanticum TaxID=357466 RepID=A0AAD4XSB4_9MAGN|nr:hypothetical protein MKW98_008526 [Papaver atlanticum]
MKWPLLHEEKKLQDEIQELNPLIANSGITDLPVIYHHQLECMHHVLGSPNYSWFLAKDRVFIDIPKFYLETLVYCERVNLCSCLLQFLQARTFIWTPEYQDAFTNFIDMVNGKLGDPVDCKNLAVRIPGNKVFFTCKGWILLASNGYFMGSRLAASTSNYVQQERATPNYYLHQERETPSVYQASLTQRHGFWFISRIWMFWYPFAAEINHQFEDAKGVSIAGFISSWFIWRSAYLTGVVSWMNRFYVAVNWNSLNYEQLPTL